MGVTITLQGHNWHIIQSVTICTCFVFCSKVKTLGEESDEEFDSASHWVKKSRKVSKEKALADKRVRNCIVIL